MVNDERDLAHIKACEHIARIVARFGSNPPTGCITYAELFASELRYLRIERLLPSSYPAARRGYRGEVLTYRIGEAL